MQSFDPTEAEEITIRLAESVSQDSILVLTLSPDLPDELEGLEKTKKIFDLIIIDCTASGFIFPCDLLIRASSAAKNLLSVPGFLVFIKQDRAFAFVKETAAGNLSFQRFDSLSAIYDFSSNIAKQIQQAMGQNIEIHKDSTDLAEQILMMTIPVLTSFGIKLKAGMDGSRRRNTVLAAIDNYTPLSAIAARLLPLLTLEQLLDELRGLEKTGAIYAIFPKIPYLVQQFRNTRAFRLKDYMLEAKLLTKEQHDELIFTMQNNKGSQRLSLGALCVSKGWINARALEIALQDQAFFGQKSEREKMKLGVKADPDSRLQSLVGNLATTDPAGVLQNLSNNRCNGVLFVEYKDLTFRAAFEAGRLTYAQAGKIKGNKAIVEFVSVWKEGVFVFMERSVPLGLAQEECRVSTPLDKLLLDSALASDKIEAVWKTLAKGGQSLLERLPDNENTLKRTDLFDPQENYPLSSDELADMQIVWSACDGINTIDEIIKSRGLTTNQGAAAISRLLYFKLARVPGFDLPGSLAKFRNLIADISTKIGLEKSETLLRISLRESLGYSAISRVLLIGSGVEIGADLAAAKAAGLPVSNVVKALEDWQVKYIEHLRHELDTNELRDIVYRIHK